MKKLIIPNTAFEPVRFLWMVEPGDVILLDKIPSQEFITYLCKIKEISIDAFKIITPLAKTSDLSNENTLLDKKLLEKIKNNLGKYKQKYRIWSYIFNSTIIKLADQLGMPFDSIQTQLVTHNLIQKLNDKSEFRKIANEKNIPHPIGTVCTSLTSLINAITTQIHTTGKLIIKQPYASGGLGNIGISSRKENFFGVHKSYLLHEDNLTFIANEIWNHYIDIYNSELIVEVYYPNVQTITAIFRIDENGYIQLINTGTISYCEISNKLTYAKKIISSIQEIKMPANLPNNMILTLLNYGYLLAQYVKTTQYQGLLSVDAIISETQEVLFTEMNVRNGGETHINYLINKLFDKSELTFTNTVVVLSVIDNFTLSLSETLDLLEKYQLSFRNQFGIIIIALNNDIQKLQYIVLAEDENHMTLLQRQFLNIIKSYCFYQCEL